MLIPPILTFILSLQLMPEYRCTRNASYLHDCIGRDDITARQGYYIKANSPEGAWKEMATRFPKDVECGFTIQEWEGFNVRVVEVTENKERENTQELSTQFPTKELLAQLSEVLEYHTPPYQPLKVPQYRPGQYGEWKLEEKETPLSRGYFTSIQSVVNNYRLCRGQILWMSLTPMELESQSHHALAAKDHTVLMGLGMGLLLYNVLLRSEVKKVTVIENDPDIVKLFYQITDATSWPGWEKVSIIIADALNWIPSEPVDYLAVDIWSALGDENLRSDGQKIQKNVQAKQVALWGQELDFITFLVERGYSQPCTLSQYHEYIDAIGIPLIEADNPNYPDYCFRAAQMVFNY
ncbi:hypothetical protein [Crocosphaera sp. XPORK-15E]|uniref:hypothetical protein n=1 Tax=Crocosphaera sp. XPORK-15E TaxID=3110247 RepID=UPI002B2148C5|nr:hypothetical protein [Crocosphaera sp. XPORK-15E]MEA5536804.1 hypothetical protein [Crocosphaera sp. XPORK-15E]